ncbi:hypothetical protein DdX_19212 [Ditylenchus destructor]|uniref:Peptidase S1 domain-containing protein n=1 Tax=Ditylenchus destructor TaxID=166010 RepID=A0AAD4MK39_9BILA|nr:hypothetical protein DdX_19212 [Ditylenchus destructor]
MRAAGKQQETVAGDSRLLENFDKASMKPSFAFIEFPHHELDSIPVTNTGCLKKCGASLISWRHLITAQHCLNRFADPNLIEVYVGGLCIAKGVGPCKKAPYMEKSPYTAWWGNSINAKEGFIEALSKFSSKRESPATISCCFPAARNRCCLSNEGNECAQLGNSRKQWPAIRAY